MSLIRILAVGLLFGLLLVSSAQAAGAPSEVNDLLLEPVDDLLADAPEPAAQTTEPVRDLLGLEGDGRDEPPVEEEERMGFGARLRDAFGAQMAWAGIASLGVTALGLIGFAMVTRYISPKEALKNPQRAMLYGFVKATPGAHLKQLSDEFKMKTSSILWHIRKLEAADLVRSERANGYRVFYSVQGGIEIKRLSRAITALHNENARAIFAAISRNAGQTIKELSQRLDVHPGTVRWHARKLRDFGLVEELVREDGALFYPSQLGTRAMETVEGTPTERPTRVPTGVEA